MPRASARTAFSNCFHHWRDADSGPVVNASHGTTPSTASDLT